MGKRTSQATPPSQPTARRKRRSLLSTVLRTIAIVLGVLLVLFLIGGWYFSGEIRSGGLTPPSSDPPDYNWTVENTGSVVTLEGSSGTDQAGQDGLSGIQWETGYAQSLDLVSSTDDGDSVIDIRSIDPETPGPTIDTKARVDNYFWRGDPLTAHTIEFDTIHYASDIGSFPAWFIDGTKDTWAIVVHGKGGTLEESLRVIPLLREQGYPILVIGYRNDVGEARDPSGYHRYGVTEWIDLAAAVTYANENGASDHILFGYSYGGSIVASYLTQSPLRNFTKAAILDSPQLSFEDTVDYRAAQTDLPLLPIKLPQLLTEFAKAIAAWRFDIDWNATNYLGQTNDMHAPMLIFHGTNDTSVPLQSSRDMSNLRPDIVTLIEDASGHTRSWNIDPAFYEQSILDFLDALD